MTSLLIDSQPGQPEGWIIVLAGAGPVAKQLVSGSAPLPGAASLALVGVTASRNGPRL